MVSLGDPQLRDPPRALKNRDQEIESNEPSDSRDAHAAMGADWHMAKIVTLIRFVERRIVTICA